ncbi:DUF4833 domain-containing protein [Aurantibacillus circumpalustris]|uniref:DUF4833 domain-containing protein n=1 Tax=Aurantibacillus circumpalustris TaxID=3036359 RepID=UPI00295AF51C|nr:DUF4833 domain-containing protein [Aurantibacillus circumpalustris]
MKKILFLFIIVFSFSLFSQRIKPFYGPFPEPTPNKKMLFYLQRTVNRNTLIYELNYDLSADLNYKEPVKVYWINFEDGGTKSELSFFQRKFAYGVNTDLIDEKNGIYEIHLVAYDKVKLYLKKSGEDNHYHVEVLIKGKTAILDKIFIKISGGSLMSPTIQYVELTGHDLISGDDVSERIKTPH